MQDYNLSSGISDVTSREASKFLWLTLEKLCQKREKLHFTSESGSGYKEKKQFRVVFFKKMAET